MLCFSFVGVVGQIAVIGFPCLCWYRTDCVLKLLFLISFAMSYRRMILEYACHFYAYGVQSAYVCIPGTQMTRVLIGKDLVLEGSRLKIEDIHRFQVYIGYGPLTVTVGNEGLVRNPLLKMVHNPGGDWHPVRGPHPRYTIL